MDELRRDAQRMVDVLSNDGRIIEAHDALRAVLDAGRTEGKLSDVDCDRIGDTAAVIAAFQKLFDSYERCNGLEPERENLIRAIAAALPSEKREGIPEGAAQQITERIERYVADTGWVSGKRLQRPDAVERRSLRRDGGVLQRLAS